MGFVDGFFVELDGDGDIFGDGEGGEEIVELVNNANLTTTVDGKLIGGEFTDVLAVYDDLAFGFGVDTADEMKESRFAGTRSANNGDKFTGLDRK